MNNYRIVEYLENGRSPFARWFNKLGPVAAAGVDKYIRRMEQGNFGNSKTVGSGVYELKIDYGPGYRVYYGRQGGRIVVLLGGGDKRRQSHDIKCAVARWGAYKKGK